MGYTSERTNINKSLESLNQETQRLQKQTNYEFDRLDQRRRQNQSANMNWLAQNQRKLDMGMQQYQELQDSYEPETGYTEKTKAMMSGMRDEYYNLLQNKVPKLDGEGNPLKDKQGNVVYEENIRAANEQRDKLMKGVKTTSMAQGNFAGVQGKMDAALSINNEAPGSLDPRTNENTTALFKPGVEKVPRWDSKAGKVVFDIRTPKMDEDGNPLKDDNGKIVYEEEVKTIGAGEFNRDVESGAIGILTYGDGGEDRNALQTEAFDQHYKDKFSKFKDMTDLNDINTYNDFRETFAGYEKHLSQMDVSKILDDNQGMSNNWTDVLNRIARNASSDFYGDNENPFRTMLDEFGLKDEDGDGKISGDELNAIGGAWKPGSEEQRALAEKFYRTYDPSSGILPTYLNDMLKTSQTIGGNQLTANQTRLAINQGVNPKTLTKVPKPKSNKNTNGSNASNKNDTKPKGKFPTYQIESEDGEKSNFNFEEDLVTDEGTYKFSPTSTPSLIVVDGPNGKEVINTSGDALTEDQIKNIENQAEKQNVKITIGEKDRLDELNSKKKSDSKVDDKQEEPVEETPVEETPVEENQTNDTEVQTDETEEQAPEIEGGDTNEQVEEITNEQVEDVKEVELNGTSIVPKEKTGVNAEIAKVLNWENDNGYGNYGFTGGNQGANNPIRKSFDNFKASLKENNSDLSDQQLNALAAQESMNQNIIGGVEKAEGNTYTGKTILDNLNEGNTTFTREQFDNLPGPIQHALIDYKTNATSRNVKDMLMIVSGSWDGAKARKNYSDLSQDEKDEYDNFDPAEFLKGWEWASDLDPNDPQQKIMIEDMERNFEVARRDLYLDNGNSPNGAKGQWSKQKDRIKTATRKIEKDDPIVTIGLTDPNNKPQTVEEHIEYFKNSTTPASFFIRNKLLPGDEITQYDGTIYTVPNY